MIPLRIKFVVMQNTKFRKENTLIFGIFIFCLKDRQVQFAIQVLNFRVCQKFDPKNIYCNLKTYIFSQMLLDPVKLVKIMK